LPRRRAVESPREKTTAQKATETSKKVRLLIKEQAQRAHKARALGEPIAYIFVNGCYDEILRAMDITTVGPENYAGLCAAKMTAERFLSKAEAEGYARHICTYATCGLGFDALRHELGTMPADSPDGGLELPTLMLGTGTMYCDPRYKWYQAAQRYNECPTHIVGLLSPPAYYSHADIEEVRDYYIEYLVDELKGVVGFLENQTGRKMDWDRLGEVVDLSERTVKLWNDIYELRKAVPAPMPTEDATTAMVPGSFMMGTEVAYDFYRELYQEVKYRVDHNIGTIPNEKYRLLWTLSVPPWYSLGLFNYFESQGAVFPIEGCYYPPPPVDIPQRVGHPLERVAWRFYHHMTRNHERARSHGVPCVEWFLQLIEDYKIDGLVFHQAMSCRTIHVGQLDQMRMIQTYIDKPLLLIEGDMIDAETYDEAETHERVDAFMELLEDYKSRQP